MCHIFTYITPHAKKKVQRRVSIQWKEVHCGRWSRRTTERFSTTHSSALHSHLQYTYIHPTPLQSQSYRSGGSCVCVCFSKMNGCKNMVLFWEGLVQTIEILKYYSITERSHRREIKLRLKVIYRFSQSLDLSQNCAKLCASSTTREPQAQEIN